MKSSYPASRWFVVCLLPFLVRGLIAQTVPIEPAKDQPVNLSPFVVQVDKDTGYLAADTLSAGRMATKLLVTPADISVLTADFLNDLAATNLTDVYNFLPNANLNDAPVGNGNGRDSGNSATIRGVPTSGNSRNYANGFPYSINAYLTERVEQVRGPSSILYGTSLSGGQINIITKRAGFNDFTNVRLQYDTQASKTATVDVNRKISNSVAVRVNVVDQGLRTWVPGYFDDTKAADAAVTARPWKGGELRFDAELGSRWRSDQPDPMGSFADASSSWKGNSITGTVTAAPSGLALVSAANPWVISNSFGPKVLNFAGYVTTFGSGINITPPEIGLRDGIGNFPRLPKRNFSQQPVNNALEHHFYAIQTVFDQSWANGFALQLGQSAGGVRRTGNPQPLFGNRYIDVETVLPDGRANPEYLQPYSVQTFAGGHLREFQNDLNFRANLVYQLRRDSFTQSFALMAQNDITVLERKSSAYGKTNAGANPTAASPNFRVYWDQPNMNAALLFPTDDGAGNTFGWVDTTSTHQLTTLSSIQLGTVGNYLGSKLTVVGGLRRDVYHFRESDPVLTNGYITSFTNNIFGSNANTASVGGTYFPVKWIGVETNVSTGFNPNIITAPFLFSGAYRPVTRNRVMSFGLRLNLWDGRIVGGINYYQQKEQNRLATQSTSTINQIWTAMGQLENRPLGGAASYTDSTAFAAQGVEVDLTANVSNRFRMLFNVSFPRAALSDALPDSHAYINANLPAWNAAVAAGVPSVAGFLANELNAVNGSVDGRSQNGTYNWRANSFGVYTIPSGFLKGLRIGGGTNVFGKRLIGNQNNLPLAYIYARSYFTANALIGYSIRVRKVPVDLQMNVSNLFNYDYPLFYNVAVAGSTGNNPTVVGAAFRSGYDYVQPRTFAFSGSVKF
jgi:outer membrane receptor protein involved in Fe transport